MALQSLVLAFSVVFPLFLEMSVGYLLRCLGVWDENVTKTMNNVVFTGLMPILIFMNFINMDINEVLNWKLLGYAFASLVVLFVLLIVIIPVIEKDKSKVSTLAQGLFRSNFLIFGIPIISTVYGAENTGPVAILAMVVIPTYNIFSVIILEVLGDHKADKKKIFISILKNQLIIATIIGMIFLALGIKMPQILYKSLNDISKITTPLALIVIGGMFKFTSVKKSLYSITVGVVGRLFVVPVILIVPAILLGFRGEGLLGLLSVYAAPHAVASVAMAQKMGGDAEFASQMVVISAAFSIISFFIWIFALKTFSFI